MVPLVQAKWCRWCRQNKQQSSVMHKNLYQAQTKTPKDVGSFKRSAGPFLGISVDSVID